MYSDTAEGLENIVCLVLRLDSPLRKYLIGEAVVTSIDAALMRIFMTDEIGTYIIGIIKPSITKQI